MIVGVAVVWVVVVGITLAVGLRLGSRGTGLLLGLLSLLSLLRLLALLGLGLGLGGRVWRRVARVRIVIVGTSEARLAVDGGRALGVLAEVVGLLRGVVATERSLPRSCVLTLGILLLPEVLTIVVVVRVSLVGSVVRGVVARG